MLPFFAYIAVLAAMTDNIMTKKNMNVMSSFRLPNLSYRLAPMMAEIQETTKYIDVRSSKVSVFMIPSFLGHDGQIVARNISTGKPARKDLYRRDLVVNSLRKSGAIIQGFVPSL